MNIHANYIFQYICDKWKLFWRNKLIVLQSLRILSSFLNPLLLLYFNFFIFGPMVLLGRWVGWGDNGMNAASKTSCKKRKSTVLVVRTLRFNPDFVIKWLCDIDSLEFFKLFLSVKLKIKLDCRICSIPSSSNFHQSFLNWIISNISGDSVLLFFTLMTVDGLQTNQQCNWEQIMKPVGWWMEERRLKRKNIPL